MPSEKARASIAAFRARYPGTLSLQEAVAFLHTNRTTFALLKERYGVHPVARSAYCALYALADLQRIQAAEQVRRGAEEAAAHLHRTIYQGEAPVGQYVAHCGTFQKIVQLPHVCTRCGSPLFEEVCHASP